MILKEEKSVVFQFTDDCILGIEEIDADHKKLFEILNEGIELADSPYIVDKYDQIREILDELLEYSNEHFAREEAYMMKLRDPEIILQRVQHRYFHNQIWELLYKDIEDLENQEAMLRRILTFLAEWLYHHIIGSDSLIGKFDPLEAWMVKENPCEFSDEYLVGHPLIDGEHKRLFELTDKVYQFSKDGVSEQDIEEILNLLKELKDYTVYHFGDEESYMESIGYDGLDAQRQAHRSFVSVLENIDTDQLRQRPEEYVKQLVEFLLSWLINHILKVDKLIPVFNA